MHDVYNLTHILNYTISYDTTFKTIGWVIVSQETERNKLREHAAFKTVNEKKYSCKSDLSIDAWRRTISSEPLIETVWSRYSYFIANKIIVTHSTCRNLSDRSA